MFLCALSVRVFPFQHRFHNFIIMNTVIKIGRKTEKTGRRSPFRKKSARNISKILKSGAHNSELPAQLPIGMVTLIIEHSFSAVRSSTTFTITFSALVSRSRRKSSTRTVVSRRRHSCTGSCPVWQSTNIDVS